MDFVGLLLSAARAGVDVATGVVVVFEVIVVLAETLRCSVSRRPALEEAMSRTRLSPARWVALGVHRNLSGVRDPEVADRLLRCPIN